eukprot:274278-Alexandrium_andersonii.AAC.1
MVCAAELADAHSLAGSAAGTGSRRGGAAAERQADFAAEPIEGRRRGSGAAEPIAGRRPSRSS